VRERELGGRGQLVGLEPAHLDEIVGRAGFSACARGPREAEDDAAVVRLQPVAEEFLWLDLEPGLLTDLAPQRIEWMLVLVQKASRQIPEALTGIERSASQQNASPVVETDRLCAGNRVRVGHVAAGTALGVILDLLDSLAADGTKTPAVQNTHRQDLKTAARAKPARPLRSAPPSGCLVSPRAVGATQHELSRIGLLATLPGETLARLAQRMTREDIPAGAGVFDEGEDGDRFYVVLSGMLAVSQQVLGAQAVLRPGDYFGEVALAMHMPRTASVRALTPATVASCDQETFDEFIRPLFADD
jgi:hypothetical protein